MQNFMADMFGERIANELTYRFEDGQEWVLASDVCHHLGIKNEKHAVKYKSKKYILLNLFRNDRRLFRVSDNGKSYNAWFVSKSGVWKIMGRSQSSILEMFRSVLFIQLMPDTYRHQLELLEGEYNPNGGISHNSYYLEILERGLELLHEQI